ncbi:MAG: flagellar biosynthetic protein FliO [Erythrobacter sp.]|nr:flagellar biosynthetic protein FliO [Erythrobacter sp.]
MVWYVIKLMLLLPLLGGMIWGSLWLARKAQAGLGQRLGQRSADKAARLVETTMLAPGMRLAVIEFHGREILVGATRNGLVRLAEAPKAEDRA